MRAIKFRGKAEVDTLGIKKGSWICGDLHTQDEYYSVDNGQIVVKVEPETIGQFTGLYDKNCDPIYEGDIIQGEYNHKHLIRYPEEDARFTATLVEFVGRKEEEEHTCGVPQKWINVFGKVVIGNVHDNPELLRGDAPA